MLTLKNITKQFGEDVIFRQVNAEFKKGMNFIVGPSGSGKSTLLKMMSGIDQDYSGNVFFNQQSVKEFNESEMTRYQYQNISFIWQNFQLIEHLTVFENVAIMLSLSTLSTAEKNQKITELLEGLGINHLSKKRVSKLSGGQKQRVAIARALIKDPDIIVADEPTGALDKKSAKAVMSILHRLAKDRVIIVVTHDRSLITDSCACFVLKDKQLNQLSQVSQSKSSKVENNVKSNPILKLMSACQMAIYNFKGLSIKFLLSAIVLAMSSFFVLLSISGAPMNEQQSILDALIEEKGDTLRDINVYTSVMSASGGDESGPNLNIEQDTSDVLKQFKDDERLEYFIANHSVSNISIQLEGIEEEIVVENSNNSAVMQGVVAGRLPNQEGFEVAIPEILIKRLGLTPDDVIGKKVDVKGGGFDWSSGQPQEVKTEVNDLTIVGVTDSKYSVETPNGPLELEFEDSFIFGLDAVQAFKKQTNSSEESISFTLRVKEVEDIMPIVNELNAAGITPLGEFESVKDILTIKETTGEQSSSISMIILVVSLIATVSVTIISAWFRRLEFAILKINGFSKASIYKILSIEQLLLSVIALVVIIISLPQLQRLALSAFSMSLDATNILGMIVAIIVGQSILMIIITGLMVASSSQTHQLLAGEKQ